jgi:hypothetical protein
MHNQLEGNKPPLSKKLTSHWCGHQSVAICPQQGCRHGIAMGQSGILHTAPDSSSRYGSRSISSVLMRSTLIVVLVGASVRICIALHERVHNRQTLPTLIKYVHVHLQESKVNKLYCGQEHQSASRSLIPRNGLQRQCSVRARQRVHGGSSTDSSSNWS